MHSVHRPSAKEGERDYWDCRSLHVYNSIFALKFFFCVGCDVSWLCVIFSLLTKFNEKKKNE